MIEDVMNIILRAENDYHFAISNAVEEAEKYAEDSRRKQGAYLDGLRRGFHEYERAQQAEFEKTLYDSMRKMNEDNAAAKEHLEDCQHKKSGQISARLKKEVLYQYGDS